MICLYQSYFAVEIIKNTRDSLFPRWQNKQREVHLMYTSMYVSFYVNYFDLLTAVNFHLVSKLA